MSDFRGGNIQDTLQDERDALREQLAAERGARAHAEHLAACLAEMTAERDALRARLATARRDAFEEAARIADEECDGHDLCGCRKIAEAHRRAIRNEDGTCGCGTNCPAERAARASRTQGTDE